MPFSDDQLITDHKSTNPLTNTVDDVEDVKDEVQSDLSKVMKALATDSKGVMVHASTLGALEALLQVHYCLTTSIYAHT